MAKVPGPRRPGEVLRYARALATRPHLAMWQLYQDYGEVAAFRVGPTRAVALFGPEANRFVFTHDELFRWREAFEFLVPLNGETALVVSDGDEHRRRRRLSTPAFSRRAIEGYAATVAAVTDGAIDTWQCGQTVDLYRELRSVIRRTTVKVLFGDRLGADADRLGERLEPLLAFVDTDGVTQQWRRRFRSPSWRAAAAARVDVDARIHREIRERRSHPDRERPDVLSRLVGTAENGTGLTDEEIRDQVVSLIAAGYETTSAALAWACLAMLTDRRVHERARAEVREAGADLAALPYLDGVVAESLRMYPPAAVSARMVGKGFTFAGHDVEPGRTLLFSPLVTHRMPQLWPDPTRFLPERWDRAAPGFRTPSPYEFLPFGGGAHRCLGAALATMEMTVVLARLLARVDLEPVPQRVRATSFIAMRPRDGVLARVGTVRG